MAKAKTAEPEIRTLLVTMKNGNIRKIDIPADWIVSYGPVAVGARNNHGDSPNVLRIYSDVGRKNLKAVFKDVVSFVDESISILERVTKTKKKAFNKKAGNGNQSYTAEVRRTFWRDPFADTEDDNNEDDLTEDVLALENPISEEPFA